MDHSPGFLAHVDAKRAGVHDISVDDARRSLASDPRAQLFDVREDREWNAKHATGATHLSRGVVERDIEKLVPDKTTPMYLYCGGGFRSTLACDSLQQMGYSNVHSIAGGWRAWEESGAATEGPMEITAIVVNNLDILVAALRTADVAVTDLVSGGAHVARVTAGNGVQVEFRQAGS